MFEETLSIPGADGETPPYYFGIQAEMGFTKHVGGAGATIELLELCEIGPDKSVLNIGCGAGVAATYVVKEYGCKMTGVDISPEMIESARRWAADREVAHLIDFRVADAQDLPFDDEQFDILICESVNTFVPDRIKAAREYARVVKPGGYVGLNEAVWITMPPQEAIDSMRDVTGQRIETADIWVAMLKSAGLVDIVERTYTVKAMEEARNQMGLVRLGEYLRVWGRTIKLYFSRPAIRKLLKQVTASESKEVVAHMGYGLFVGRKPEN